MIEVYHSSRRSSIKELKLMFNHIYKKKYVFAAKDLIMSSLFLSHEGGDFVCAVGRDNKTGRPYICERFEGAFDIKCKYNQGSIYILSGEKFLEGKTRWNEEVVALSPVKPIKEIRVENVKEYLFKLEKEGKLIIKYYPEKIDNIPDDNSDLIERVFEWGILFNKRFSKRCMNAFKKYHPKLFEKLRKDPASKYYFEKRFNELRKLSIGEKFLKKYKVI